LQLAVLRVRAEKQVHPENPVRQEKPVCQEKQGLPGPKDLLDLWDLPENLHLIT
jgi:hypothetical protein